MILFVIYHITASTIFFGLRIFFECFYEDISDCLL